MSDTTTITPSRIMRGAPCRLSGMDSAEAVDHSGSPCTMPTSKLDVSYSGLRKQPSSLPMVHRRTVARPLYIVETEVLISDSGPLYNLRDRIGPLVPVL